MHIAIAGMLKCPQYVYATMIAQKLKENLPDFSFAKMPKKPGEWERWLVQICKENEWHHIKSPLIWREISMRRGKKYYIGDTNKFLDLCFDHYGIPKEALTAGELQKPELDWFMKRTESEYFEKVNLSAQKMTEYRCRQICITGASSYMTDILIMELIQIPSQHRKNGLEIRLYDEARREKRLQNIAADARYSLGISGLGTCRVAYDLKEALYNVDLVIVLDNFIRRPHESLAKWLKRNRNAMCALGKALDKYAQTHCRVVLGGFSSQPLCYNATVLASFATKLHVRNIVAVTQDLGRETLGKISQVTKAPLKDLYCPPVWGFVGLNKYVDIRRTLQNYTYKVPGKRWKSTLPQGTEELQIRTIECLISDEEIGRFFHSISSRKNESLPRLGRPSCLAKVASIIDLLKVWSIGQEDGNGEILSLGVYSDGTFNIPEGIYWSQPVTLEKGFWVPFRDYPIPRNKEFDLYHFFLLSVGSLYRTKVKPRHYHPSKPKLKPKSRKKFDFEDIRKAIGIPTIRNELECIVYLKKLAKEELGIDIDGASTIEEVPEIEDIKTPKEKIWCECWREELKQLQEIVFVRSSSSEIEADLSDNISGSEWSAINPRISSVAELSTKKESTSSDVTVCECGEDCQCLKKEPDENLEMSVEGESTEHYYKNQNAQIFQGDSKDALYIDTYTDRKRVSFDPQIPDDEKEKFHLKFYGREDAIKDELAIADMKRRIRIYEREGEESYEGSELSEKGEETEISLPERVRKKSQESTSSSSSSEEKEEGELGEREEEEEEEIVETKFHVSVSGAPYEIIGDPGGLEYLEVMRRGTTTKRSVESFREMYADTIRPSLHVVSTETETSRTTETSTTEDERDNERIEGERTPERKSEVKIDGHVDEYAEGLFEIPESEEEEEKMEEEAEKAEEAKVEPKMKWEGIPKCYLCRCIIPEGLLGCPCGATTVVEVFKKESEEVLVESDDEISFRVEYIETRIPTPDAVVQETSKEEEKEDEGPKKKDIFNLPPESFLPFTPKPENKFKPFKRPDELDKDYIDSHKPDLDDMGNIPPQCFDLLRAAENEFEEAELQKKARAAENEAAEVEEKRKLSKLSEEENEKYEMKTQFSDLKMAIPAHLEDWQFLVKSSYREWFFDGPKIRDDSYYEVAIEEASEDEFEQDDELNKYFEN